MTTFNAINSPQFPALPGAAGVILISNGTKYVETTPTYPSASGSTGQILRSDGTNNVYTTATFPATTTVNQLLYSSSANVVAGLATANSAVLITSGAGVPSLSTTLPSGLAATNLTLTTPTLGAATATSVQFSPTTGGVIGTTTNDNASTGTVGEFISSVIGTGSALSCVSGAGNGRDVTSISLTAGDWDVWGNVTWIAAATTIWQNGFVWVNSTSNTSPDNSLTASMGNSGIALSTFYPGFSAPMRRFSLASTTTIYLSVAQQFSTSTLTVCGGIYARRVR